MDSFGQKPLCIMFVDDNTGDRVLFREILKAIDANIHYLNFDRAQSALDYFDDPQARLPDYIFLDVNMPGMNGIECLNILKHMPVTKDIPVLMYSTDKPASYFEAAKLLGAAGYVNKSLDFDESVTQIGSLISTVLQNQNTN